MSARWMISVLTAGMSRPALDDVGGQQDVVFAVAELGHHALELGGREAAVRLDHAGFGDDLAQAVGHAVHVLDAGHDAEHLAAAEALALDRLADDHAVERRR